LKALDFPYCSWQVTFKNENRREWMGVEPTVARRATHHRF
jgi:hypothetical protein